MRPGGVALRMERDRASLPRNDPRRPNVPFDLTAVNCLIQREVISDLRTCCHARWRACTPREATRDGSNKMHWPVHSMAPGLSVKDSRRRYQNGNIQQGISPHCICWRCRETPFQAAHPCNSSLPSGKLRQALPVPEPSSANMRIRPTLLDFEWGKIRVSLRVMWRGCSNC